MEQTEKDLLKALVAKKDVFTISKWLFDFTLSPTQCMIVRKIVFDETKRLLISAHTRFGKTQSVMIAIGILLLFKKNIKVALIGAEYRQAMQLREYLTDLILASPQLRSIVDINATGLRRLKKETSRARQTFMNGNVVQVFSASGEADRIMGFGGNYIISDEGTLIGYSAWTKILRMLGDDPEKSVLVCMFNPWGVDNKVYDLWVQGRFERIHVDWRTGVKEGRITKEFVNEMRDSMTPLEFQVLYESEFPQQSSDSLFAMDQIKECMNKETDFSQEYRLDSKLRFIVAVDPADKGDDETVAFYGFQYGNEYEIPKKWYFSEAKSDQIKLANRLWGLHERFNKGGKTIFKCDYGMGQGVISRLQELCRAEKSGALVEICRFGGGSTNKRFFLNAKAEQYYRLSKIIADKRISLPDERKLLTDLMRIRWQRSGTKELFSIQKLNDSPDWADALVIFTWENNKNNQLVVGSVSGR